MIENKKKLPIDFRPGAVVIVYIGALIFIGYLGTIFGALISVMILSLGLGFLVGLPAARWELHIIRNHWDEIGSGGTSRLGFLFFPDVECKKSRLHFFVASLLVPPILLLLAYLFYWHRMLSETKFSESVFLLIRWNGWYYLPYFFGLEFASVHFPRLVAVSSLKKIRRGTD